MREKEGIEIRRLVVGLVESPFSNQFRRLSRKIRDCGFRLLFWGVEWGAREEEEEEIGRRKFQRKSFAEEQMSPRLEPSLVALGVAKIWNVAKIIPLFF